MDNKDHTPKAHWDLLSTKVFCEICVKQTKAGNRPTMFLSSEGYKNLGREFFEKTRKSYTRKQFKNKWDSLKALYLAWIYYTEKATGLGWDPEKLTITADDDQWADMIKKNKLVEGFKRGPPDNLGEMEDMFRKACVDGSKSVMPGAETQQVPPEYTLLDEEEEDTPSPMF